MELAILLYTISDDELREELCIELETNGWQPHPDQSTYVYSMYKIGQYFLIEEFDKWLTSWAKDKCWGSDDFIAIHYLSPVAADQKFFAIKDRIYRWR